MSLPALGGVAFPANLLSGPISLDEYTGLLWSPTILWAILAMGPIVLSRGRYKTRFACNLGSHPYQSGRSTRSAFPLNTASVNFL